MRAVSLLAAVGLAFAEAALAFLAAVSDGLDVAFALCAALGAGALVGSTAIFLLWPLDVLTRTAGGGALTQGLHQACAARSVALTTAACLGPLGVSVLAVTPLAAVFTAHMSARFAAVCTVLASLATFVGTALLAVAVVHALGRGAKPRGPRAALVDRALALVLVGGVLAAALGVFVGARYGLAPLCGALMAITALGWRRSPPVSNVWRAAPLATLALCVLSVALLERLPAHAGQLIAARTPYASLVLGLGQKVFDRDGDGYGSRFLGGDCDDANPKVHPGAREVPENGKDENCSGKDAPRYAPPLSRSTEEARAKLREPMDIVILFMDALRPDRLSRSGYRRKTSPSLDAFARDNVWFRHAYTNAPSTRFAMASLFTGRDARRLDYRDTGGNNFKLQPGAETVARQLRAGGYRTIGFTITYVVGHNQGMGQGFDSWKTPWARTKWKATQDQRPELTTEAVLDTLRRADPARRLFVFAHYDCTHTPYLPDPAHDFGAARSDLYDSAIIRCDRQLGRVLAALKARPSWDRTAVFVVSDHGELFEEHGYSSHGNTLYEPDVRIVLAARVPGAPAHEVDEPVQLSQVAPTVLELAGRTPSAKDVAASLLDAILLPRRRAAQPLFLFTELRRGSARFSANAALRWPHKLIRDDRTRALSLYDVARDPKEQRSLVGAQPELAASLADLLEGYEAWVKR